MALQTPWVLHRCSPARRSRLRADGGRQLSRLQEDGVGDPDLADVVEVGALGEGAQLLGPQAEPLLRQVLASDPLPGIPGSAVYSRTDGVVPRSARLVDIAPTAYPHTQMPLIEAMRAGADVWVQKPISVDVAIGPHPPPPVASRNPAPKPSGDSHRVGVSRSGAMWPDFSRMKIPIISKYPEMIGRIIDESTFDRSHAPRIAPRTPPTPSRKT